MVTTKAFRKPPDEGQILYFYGLIYVAGWMDFRDPSGGFEPSFCYSRTPTDVSGTLIWRKDKPEINLGFTCRRFIQRQGTQTHKVLGEWLPGNYVPLVTFTANGLTPCEPPPPPVDPKSGKPGRKPAGMFARLDAVLRIDGTELTFAPLAHYDFSYNKMNELMGITFTITATAKGRAFGLERDLADKDVDFKLWTACYTEPAMLAETKKASLSEIGIKEVVPPLPAKPDKARLGTIAASAEFGDPSADERARQEAFAQTYFTSMDLAMRAKAVESLKDCKHPSTRALLAQVCYMERDVDLNLRAFRQLAAMPCSDPSLAQMLAGAFEVSPPQRRSEYAEIAANHPFRYDLANAFAKWLQRARYPRERQQPKLKPGQAPPAKTPQEIEEDAARAAYLMVLKAFNALTGATFAVGPNGIDGRQVRDWWEQHWDAVYQSDIDTQRRLSAAAPGTDKAAGKTAGR